MDPDGKEGQWANGNYWDHEAETLGMDARIGRAHQNLGKNIAENLDMSPALIVGTGMAGVGVAITKISVKSTLKAGGGGTLNKLSRNEIRRIQNAANRSGQEIGVVGSRVNPNKALNSKSDYDFVINANSKTRSNLSRSLPGAKSVREGIPNNQDIFKGSVDTSKPHVIFRPE